MKWNEKKWTGGQLIYQREPEKKAKQTLPTPGSEKKKKKKKA